MPINSHLQLFRVSLGEEILLLLGAAGTLQDLLSLLLLRIWLGIFLSPHEVASTEPLCGHYVVHFCWECVGKRVTAHAVLMYELSSTQPSGVWA